MRNFFLKRNAVFILAAYFIILSYLLPIISFASNADNILWDEYVIPSTRQKELLLDNANLLTDSEESTLLSELNSLSRKWSCNVAVLTVYSHNGSIQNFADDYFDYNGFGADYNGSGILFMLSMEDREWAISTSGNAIQAFTDYGQEKMVDAMLSDLSYGDYYEAFETYIQYSDRYLQLYSSGHPYDIGSKYKTSSDLAKGFVVCLIIGLVAALFPILIMRSRLETVHMRANASGYQAKDGIRMTVNEDRYTHSRTSRVAIPKDSGRGGSGGGHGGSSMHTSSSGSSHGGSHGHF